jgi:hypothetical protein
MLEHILQSFLTNSPRHPGGIYVESCGGFYSVVEEHGNVPTRTGYPTLEAAVVGYNKLAASKGYTSFSIPTLKDAAENAAGN